MKLRNPWGSSEWTGDWSDESPLWTDELREAHGCTIEDDGMFFIPLSAYIDHFVSTSICFENNPEKYFHSSIMHEILEPEESNDRPFSMFSFELTHEVNFGEEGFAISVQQQGQRLGCYRLKDEQKKFDPS